MIQLQSVRIRRFKRIDDASIDLKDINVLVGGNNSGKSSIIQGLHFGIGLLQTIELGEGWPASRADLSTSLNPNQIIYSPSENVNALGPGAKLFEDENKACTIDFVIGSGETFSVQIRKGRNRNILVAIKNAPVAKALSSLERPFSIFSPGLAGIAKRELFVADGVLLRTIARGDANLVLRNILHRLSSTTAWNSFLTDLHEVFPGVDIKVDFDPRTDETIEVQIKTDRTWVPLEITGTGVLQAIQILSYIHRFEPSIVVLDEPDSHLHPNNQRLLCALLRRVAEDRGTQVMLTTHSRHIVDAIGRSSGFLWVRNGLVDVARPDDEIGILLDIGALDVKERVTQPGTKAIVLTEDEITRPLEAVLESSGFVMTHTTVLPYFGISSIRQLRPLMQIINTSNPQAKVVVHRDRDFLTNDEVSHWENELRAFGANPYVTPRRDIEGCFVRPDYLSQINRELTEIEFRQLLQEILSDLKERMIADYVNGRTDIVRKTIGSANLNPGDLAVEASRAVNASPEQYCGKMNLRELRNRFQSAHGKNLITFSASPLLRDDGLFSVAQRAFGSGAT
jgi:hypothetical protein